LDFVLRGPYNKGHKDWSYAPARHVIKSFWVFSEPSTHTDLFLLLNYVHFYCTKFYYWYLNKNVKQFKTNAVYIIIITPEETINVKLKIIFFLGFYEWSILIHLRRQTQSLHMIDSQQNGWVIIVDDMPRHVSQAWLTLLKNHNYFEIFEIFFTS
jgi:hypothetical protein